MLNVCSYDKIINKKFSYQHSCIVNNHQIMLDWELVLINKDSAINIQYL